MDSQINALKADDVHVWIAVPEQCHQPDLIATYLAWLDAHERSRYDRFRFPAHRHEYLVAHALLRSCLSRYGSLQPWEWRFVKNTYGRPEIDPPHDTLPLRFNLSHTAGLVACAITRKADVGVDVECTSRKGDLAAVAESSFAPAELAGLAQLTGAAWGDRFFELWTLKEAYIKARGMGLSLPMQRVVFQLDHDLETPIRLASLLEPAQADSGQISDWRFVLLSPMAAYRLAVAVQSSLPLRVQVGRAIPGEALQVLQLPLLKSQGVV